METECSFLDYSFINFTNTESLLTTSQYAKVIFHNIKEKYNCNQDLLCNYSLTEQFAAKTGDRVILYKLGWQEISEFVLYEWITIPEESSPLQVKFKAADLPRDKHEFYQLCYISGENAVCGASIPFQFTSEDSLVTTSTDSDCFVSLQMDSNKTVITQNEAENEFQSETLTTDVPNNSTHMPISQELIEKLMEDNVKLKNDLLLTNSSLQNCDSQLSELKFEVESLRNMLRVTQNDVSDLKTRMDIANEEYRKLYAEKTRVEKKYEKLVKKCQSKSKTTTSESSSDLSSDLLGELDPLPPFPLLM